MRSTMQQEKQPPAPETVRALFQLVGIELTEEQLGAAQTDFAELETVIGKLNDVEVGEAEPVFFLPADAESR